MPSTISWFGDDIQDITSVMTVLGGKVVYGDWRIRASMRRTCRRPCRTGRRPAMAAATSRARRHRRARMEAEHRMRPAGQGACGRTRPCGRQRLDPRASPVLGRVGSSSPGRWGARAGRLEMPSVLLIASNPC
ncbi:hypothetical protein ACTMU2_18920 [Cupriavidus basilensis]